MNKKTQRKLEKLVGAKPAVKKVVVPEYGTHEYLVANPPRWLKDPALREYWSKWAATTNHSQYGPATSHFRSHALAVVEGRAEAVK